MSRSSAVLALSLGTLAVAACTDDRGPTQPDSPAAPADVTAIAAFTPNTWTLKKPAGGFSTGLSAGAFPDASGQSLVYTFGGTDDQGGTSAAIGIYRIGTNTWSSPGSEPRVDVFNTNGVGRIGKLLYFSGGENFAGGSFQIDGRLWAYDPAANTLTQKAFPPKATSQGVTGVIGGSLYVLPGICSTDQAPPLTFGCDQPAIRRLWRYNAASNVWSLKKSAPHYHTQSAAGVINGMFYVAGGMEGLSGKVAALDRYNPATDTWTTLAPLPVAGAARGTAILGKLFAVVQPDPTNPLNQRAYSYDPATNTWTRKAAPHWDHPAYVTITWGTKQFVLGVGGSHFDAGFTSNPTEVYAP